MRIVYADGRNRPSPVPPLSDKPTRRIPVIIIRTGSGGDEGSPEKPSGGDDDSTGIDVAGTDYRLTLSPEALERDREVRSHERAHLSALGGYAASDVMYDTRRGPGVETVAVGGRIAVDLTEVPGDPRATLQKARTIYAAATAPGNPSTADMRVAAEAYRLMRTARRDLAEQRNVSIEA